jgi:hypothetical protein
MGYLSVCAIVKDEDQYLPEWITYYRIMGASHFWIYDNGSKIPVAKALEKITHGDITVIPFPGRQRQLEAYTDALERSRGKTVWLAAVDLDEFVIPKKASDLRDVLRGYENYGGLVINWLMFGPSGRTAKPDCLQLEAYQARNPAASKVNEHIKTIVFSERALKCRDSHSFFYKDGFYAVNERRVRVDGSSSSPVSVDTIQINHYFTRTIEEYKIKIAKGCANTLGFKDLRLFEATDREATEVDGFATKFASHLRAGLYNDRIVIPPLQALPPR